MNMAKLQAVDAFFCSIGIYRYLTHWGESGGFKRITLERGDDGVNEVFDTMEYPGGWSLSFERRMAELGFRLEIQSDNYLNILEADNA
tara:strand:+ start:576 stop:839 length:264 start_codon:yes stop_codon:yes gene_type:complete